MPILFVQSKMASGTTANIAATFATTPIAGNLLVAYYSSSTLSSAPTITGWTALTAANSTTTASRSGRLFYKIAGASESTTVTTVAAASTNSLTILEYSGIDATNPLVIGNAAVTTASTTYTTPSVTSTAGIGVLVVTGLVQAQTTTVGFTAQQVNASATGVNVRGNGSAALTSSATVFDSIIASSATTYVGKATQATSVVGAGNIAVFRGATIPGKFLAYETWTGTTGAAWPSQWTQTTNGTDGTATIQANAGRLTTSTNSFAFGGQTLAGVSSINQRLLIDVTLNGDNTEQYPYFGIRSAGSFNSYYPTREYYIKINPDNTYFTAGTHVDNEYGFNSANITSGTASSTVHFDVAIIGGQLTVYAWVGTTKPSTPTYDYATGNPIPAAGSIMLYQSNGTTGIAHTMTFDNMHLTTGVELTNSTAPVISGTAATGQVLTTSVGAWNATPDSYIYQWYRNGLTIVGSTAATYTVVTADVGTVLTSYVQAVKATYRNGGASSAGVTAFANGITNSTVPTISGTATNGNTLTSSTGTWTNSPTAYAYQWNRDGVAISGATSSTYVLVVADSGHAVTVTVVASRASYASGSATSAAVNPTGGTLVATTAPSITGTLTTGSTATIGNGVWTPTPDSYTYQWFRDGTAISGATANTYVLTISDQGLPLTASVTAIKSGYSNVTATSAAVTPKAVVVADVLSFWKSSLTNRATTPTTVTVMGGAIAEGQGASTRGTRWVSRLRDMLRRNYRTTGVIGGEGYIPAGFNTYGPDSGWNMWYTSSTGSINYDVWSANLGYRLMGLGNSSSLTYTFIGTDIDIWYTSGYGQFSYSIDGGASTFVPVDTNYLTNNYKSVTGLTAGTHTVTLSTASADSAVINGFFIYNGDKNKGIRLADAGHNGFTLNQYLGDTDHFILSLASTNPGLVIIEVGGVDAQSYSPTVFQKQLQNFLNYYLSGYFNNSQTPPSILLLATYLPNASLVSSYLAPWSQYVAAMQAVATNTQVGFLDLSATMPQSDSSGSSYYSSTDGTNPNDYGQMRVAQLVFNAIADTNANYTKGLATWYTALTNRASKAAKWFALGDSLTEGQGASAVWNRWTSQTAKLLQANYPVLGVKGGMGFKPGQYNVYSPDSTWANWYSATNGSISAGSTGAGPGYRLTYFPAGSSRTYPFVGTDIDIWVYNGGGTLAISIDGGTAQSVTPSSNGGTTIISKTGYTSGGHTITISASVAAAITGFMIYDGDKSKGIQFYDSGRTGATTATFTSDQTNFLNNVTTIAPDLITVEIGANDAATDKVAVVLNHVLALANALSDVANIPAIAVIIPYISSTSTTASTQAQYNEAYKMIAQAVGGIAIDFGTFMPTTDTSGTGYYSTDGIHPNDSGHTRIANNLITTLADTRITPPATGTVLATETWSLANGAAWPAQWTNTIYSGAAIDVQNGMGHIQTAAATGSIPGNTYLSGMAAVSDAEVQLDFMIPNVALEQYPLIGMRVQSPAYLSNGDPSTGYIFNSYPNLNQIEILLSNGFVSLVKGSFTFSNGTTYSVRWQIVGTTTRARIWIKGQTEPTTWTITASNATVTTPGKVTVYTENGSSNSSAGIIYYDNLTVLTAGTPRVYIGNKVIPLGYVGSRPITAVYIGPNKVL